jgi:hypothetical protein
MLRLSLVGMVIFTLLGWHVSTVVGQEEAAEPVFPTGTFVADEDGLTLEFRADGTCLRAGVPCTYVVRADAYTETTFDDPTGEQVPATYIWDYDGERLAFERWAHDLRPERQDVYYLHTFRPVGETLPLKGPETGFPTGTFVSLENPEKVLEFNADGTARSFMPGRSEARFTYGVTEDLYAEMTFSMLGSDPKAPATYHWDWDGELLSFKLWGEDHLWNRHFTYAENTWAPVEDPRVVVFATSDIEVGDKVFRRMAQLRVVPAAEVGDAFTDTADVAGRIAAVPIAEGEPITPAMLEPPAAE